MGKGRLPAEFSEASFMRTTGYTYDEMQAIPYSIKLKLIALINAEGLAK